MSGQELALAISVFLACAVEAVEALTIVLAIGVTRGWRWALTGVAAATAAIAVVVVAAVGFAVRAPLARVPENAMKFSVGVMLTSFGIFWGAEGAGASWPGGDLALLAIVPGVLLASLGLVQWLRRESVAPAVGRSTA